jgi:hypothetical protein
MVKKKVMTIIFLLVLKMSFGQVFEGKINYESYFLDKETMKPLFDPVPETVTIKGGKYKIFLPGAQKGQLEWEIDNFYEGSSLSRKSYKNVDYPVSDKEPTFSKDGKLIFQKPDSALVAPILKGVLCIQVNDTFDVFTKLDTTYMIHGLICNVIIRTRNEKKINEYYYCDSIKLDPIQYKCNRRDKLDKLYKLTKGSLIVQLVAYDDLYTLVYQLQSITSEKIDDKVFDIPNRIKIENIKYN